LHDESKTIPYQAASELVRLHLLEKYGGVWVDANVVCMRMLDEWVHEAVRPSGVWMYRGRNMDEGAVTCLMCSLPGSYMMVTWANQAREYWLYHSYFHDYDWMRGLFCYLVESKTAFREAWEKVPWVDSTLYGQIHCLFGRMFHDDADLKHRLLNRPPYAVKLSASWTEENPDGTLYSDSLAAFVLDVATRTCLEQ